MTANISDPRALHTLQHGAWSATIDEFGGRLVQLKFENAELVAGGWPDSADWFAGSTLAPWVNRLEDGAWIDASGVKHSAVINDAANGCANHGLVFNRNFNVTEVSEDAITLTVSCFDESAYPFEVLLSVTYSLCTSGLRVRVSATNHSEIDAPFAVGGHPYVVAEANSVLKFVAKKVFANDARMLPKEILDNDSSDHEIAIRPTVLDDFTDTCFSDLDRDPAGKARVRLSRPSLGKDIVLFQSHEFSHLQVFTLQAKALTGYEALVALEPQTAAANALRTGANLIHLAPREQFAAQWGIRLEDSKND